MRSWLILLAGPILWAVQFFLLYGIVEFGGEGAGARLAVIAVMSLGLLVGAMSFVLLRRLPQANAYDRWRNGSALAGLSVAMIAMVWQALPALFPG